jgi:hypothetical protein
MESRRFETMSRLSRSGHLGCATPVLAVLIASCGDAPTSQLSTAGRGSASTGGSVAQGGGASGSPAGSEAAAGGPAAGASPGGAVTSGGASNGGARTGGASASGGASAGGASSTGSGGATGGSSARGGTAAGGGSAVGGAATAGTGTGGKATGGTAAGGASVGGGASGGTGAAADCGSTPGPTPPGLNAIRGNGTVGLEWTPVLGATSYNVYWSTSAGVTPGTGQALTGIPRGYVQTGLTNGTPYYYVVTAVTAGGESPPSAEVSATPSGEWVLEQLGTGDFSSILSACPVPAVPIASRIHVLLFPEGYTTAALPTLHSDATHATRNNDVDRWIDEVFAIEPYRLFPQAFVIWYLPRASSTDINGGSTAFSVTISLGAVTATTATAAPAWAAVALHPYPPTLFDDPGSRNSARNVVGAFLVYDPARSRAGLSGLTTTLANPSNTNQRLSAAFAMGHAHEFTHAMSWLRDEYMETTSPLPSSSSGTSNVVATNQCSQLPWAHLLYLGPINPSTDQLVGAFGEASLGFHSELLCLMNGTHDNGLFFYRDTAPSSSCTQTSCTLRPADRMCNFCREVTALRTFQRSGILSTATTGFDTWVSQYRTPFYGSYGFKVPALVPQSNDISPPDNGATIFQACVP